MNLEHFDLQYNSAQKTINDKIFECSSKLSQNPNDYQSLFELILIAINTQQYNLALNFINEGNKLLPLSSELFIAEIRVLLLKGEIEEAQNKISKFLNNYLKYKGYKNNRDTFLYLSNLSSSILLDYKLSNHLVLSSIKEFPEDYRGYEMLAKNKIYLFGDIYEGRKLLKQLITKYHKVSSLKIYINSFLIDDPLKGCNELMKFYHNFKTHNDELVLLKYGLISSFWKKEKLLEYLNKNKICFGRINYQCQKMQLGYLETNELNLNAVKTDYKNYLFKYKYQANFSEREKYFNHFQMTAILLAKKFESNKKFDDEIKTLKTLKEATFQKRFFSSPSKARVINDLLPLNIYKDQLDYKKKINIHLNKDSSVNPIFIVGLPRSGSTVVEKLISNPNKVFDCDESLLIDKYINKIKITENVENLYKFYCKNFDQIINFKYFTDKTLGNFCHMDLIIDLFPNAKFVHCTRDLKENIIGIFKQNFDQLPWSYTLESILKYVDHYLKLMNFLNKKYEKYIFEINHKRLVLNKEEESKKLFNFLNIEWSKKVFNFSSTRTFTNTASKNQIKDGINSKYLDKYFHYYNLFDKFKHKYDWLNY